MISVKKGDRISEYILEEPLGRGGFGEVWRAHHHLWSDRKVAVKIPTSAEAIRELSNEGILQASLEHPGIARPLGMDTFATPPYFITEFVPGTNLRQLLLDHGPFDPEEALRILERVLEILDYAHSHGVVHQDIKPENILVTPEGEVKLTDFGLGQTVDGESVLLSASLRTETPMVGGTLAYIAPEIRDGEKGLDGRADLYSLGIVLFELLTGRRPAGVELPSDLREGLPRWCDEIFRGLYARRESRLEKVEAVRARLGELGAGRSDGGLQKEGVRVIPLSPPDRRLISTREACRILDLSERELRHWVGRGELTPVAVNGNLFLDAEQVFKFRSKHPGASSADAPPAGAGGMAGHGEDAGARAAVAERAPVRAERRARSVGSRPAVRAVGAGAGGSELRPAGFFVRTLAMLLDMWVLLMAGLVLTPIRAVLGMPFPPILMNWMPTGLIFAFLYFSLMTGLHGRTVGKMALGLRVVRSDGSPLNAFDGFVRAINYVLSALPLFFGFLGIIISPHKLALHDLICGTRVIHDRSTSRRRGCC
ncbi:MAG: protein kinase [Planctomycetota bacterium]